MSKLSWAIDYIHRENIHPSVKVRAFEMLVEELEKIPESERGFYINKYVLNDPRESVFDTSHFPPTVKIKISDLERLTI